MKFISLYILLYQFSDAAKTNSGKNEQTVCWYQHYLSWFLHKQHFPWCILHQWTLHAWHITTTMQLNGRQVVLRGGVQSETQMNLLGAGSLSNCTYIRRRNKDGFAYTFLSILTSSHLTFLTGTQNTETMVQRSLLAVARTIVVFYANHFR